MQPSKHLSRLVNGLVLVVLLAASPLVAYADATVTVELKGEKGAAVDGTVELVKGETRFRCTTTQGHCELKGVGGGMYEVQVTTGKKPEPKAKQVMIPPSGEVKLVVNAG